jgi:hypothetical protein
MAARTVGAFAAGVAVGWVGRSVLGSGRELFVRAVVLAYQLRERVAQVAAEQVEWVEDSFAEGRARYASRRDEPPTDDAPLDDQDGDEKGRAA